MYNARRGFTIVELLIVIVIIGILASITIVAYNGIQVRAQNAKINSDLSQLQKAITMARLKDTKTLWQLTGGRAGATDTNITADQCGRLASGTDFASLVRTHTCWTKYLDTLEQISLASDMNVRGLVDPWGRPYMIYENEGRATPSTCEKDSISIFQRPHVQWAVDIDRAKRIDNILTGC